LAEVVQGIDAELSAIPPSPLVEKKRAILMKEVADNQARGLTVDAPHEWSGGSTVAPVPDEGGD
jgi:hypothetical protein